MKLRCSRLKSTTLCLRIRGIQSTTFLNLQTFVIGRKMETIRWFLNLKLEWWWNSRTFEFKPSDSQIQDSERARLIGCHSFDIVVIMADLFLILMNTKRSLFISVYFVRSNIKTALFSYGWVGHPWPKKCRSRHFAISWYFLTRFSLPCSMQKVPTVSA